MKNAVVLTSRAGGPGQDFLPIKGLILGVLSQVCELYGEDYPLQGYPSGAPIGLKEVPDCSEIVRTLSHLFVNLLWVYNLQLSSTVNPTVGPLVIYQLDACILL